MLKLCLSTCWFGVCCLPYKRRACERIKFPQARPTWGNSSPANPTDGDEPRHQDVWRRGQNFCTQGDKGAPRSPRRYPCGPQTNFKGRQTCCIKTPDVSEIEAQWFYHGPRVCWWTSTACIKLQIRENLNYSYDQMANSVVCHRRKAGLQGSYGGHTWHLHAM